MADGKRFVALVMLLVHVALLPFASALRLGWMSSELKPCSGLLTPALTHRPIDESFKPNFYEILKPHFALIENDIGQPTCQSVATAALRHSCSAFDDRRASSSSTGSDHIIAESLMLYAARLAVCELQEAHAPVPSACKAFVPTDGNTKKQTVAGHLGHGALGEPTVIYSTYDEETSKDPKQCVQALWAKEQSWTSYSNSKQNAMDICAALQGAAQNQKTMTRLQKIMQAAGGLSDQLERVPEDFRSKMQQAMNQLHENNMRKHEEFNEALEELLRKVHGASDFMKMHMQSIDRSVQDVSTSLASQHMDTERLAELLSYMQNVLGGDVLQNMREVSDKAHELNDLVASSDSSLAELKSNVDDTAIRAALINNGLDAVGSKISAFTQGVREMEEHMGPFKSVLAVANWPNLVWWVKKIFLCATCTIVVGLWSFAILVKLRLFPFIGSMCAASGTGFAFGALTAVCFDPAEIFEAGPTDVFQDDVRARKQVTFGAAVGIMATLGCVMLHHALHQYYETNFTATASQQTETEGKEEKGLSV